MHVEETSKKRLEKLHQLKYSNVNLKSELIDSQKNNANLHKELSDWQGFKTVRDYKKVRSGKSNEWPLWILQLVLEMLVNGTPLSVTTKNIASQAALSTLEFIVQLRYLLKHI